MDVTESRVHHKQVDVTEWPFVTPTLSAITSPTNTSESVAKMVLAVMVMLMDESLTADNIFMSQVYRFCLSAGSTNAFMLQDQDQLSR